MGQFLNSTWVPSTISWNSAWLLTSAIWQKTVEIRHTKNNKVVESGKRFLVSGAYIICMYIKIIFSYVSIHKWRQCACWYGSCLILCILALICNTNSLPETFPGSIGTNLIRSLIEVRKFKFAPLTNQPENIRLSLRCQIYL